MHHLGEVTRADRAGVHEPVLRRRLEAVEGRLDLGDVFRGAAGHQRVAVVEPPDATRDTAVDVADAALGQLLGGDLVVGPARVAAVDDHVALAHQLAQRRDGLPGGVAGGNHHPDDLGTRQRLYQLLEAGHVPQLGVAVEADHRVAVAAQALAHVAAHLAEADHADVHGASSRVRSGQVCRRTGINR